MVPVWFRRKKPSAAAMLVYVNLASFGRFDTETATYEECRPSVETLAEVCDLAPATVKRALAELYGLGAVERRSVIEKGKGKRPSVYRVIFGSVEGPAPAVTLADLPTDGADMSHRDGSDLSHGFTSQNANLSHRAMAQADGSNGDGSNLSHEEEVTLTHNHEEEKINTDAQARDPLTSPAFLIDSTPSGGVLSRHTASVGDAARAFYAETKRVTEDIMNGYAGYFTRETGEQLSESERRKISVVVSGIVNERQPGDDIQRLRNAIACGLDAWTRSNSFSAKQIPDFVLMAKRSAAAPAAAPSRAQQRTQRHGEVLASVAGKSVEQLDAELEAGMRRIVEESKSLGFGSKLGNLAIGGAS